MLSARVQDLLAETFLYDIRNAALPPEIDFHLPEGSSTVLPFSIWLQDPGTMQQSERFNRLFLTYAADTKEHFFGFGEQFTHFDMKGRRVPVWVSEQGVGRGEQPITLGANLTNGGAGGNAFTTYAPMPFFMTDRMNSFFLTNSVFSRFDLRKADRVQIEVWSPTVYGNIVDGKTPQEIIAQFSRSGSPPAMPALPDWIHAGAIVGMLGGTEKVQGVYEQLQKRSTPIAAFWLQDWVGQRETSFGKQLWWNWEVDYDRYLGWEEMVAGLEEENIRVMLLIDNWRAFGVKKDVAFQKGVDGYTGAVDTEIAQGYPDNDYSSYAVLSCDGSDSGEDHNLIRFNNLFGPGPGQVPLGQTILKATLTLNIEDEGGLGNLHRMNKDWTASVTWNTFDPVSYDGVLSGTYVERYVDDTEAVFAPDASFTASAVGPIVIDLPVATIQAWADGTATNYGWALLPTTTDCVDWSSVVALDAGIAIPVHTPPKSPAWSMQRKLLTPAFVRW